MDRNKRKWDYESSGGGIGSPAYWCPRGCGKRVMIFDWNPQALERYACRTCGRKWRYLDDVKRELDQEED